MSRLEELIRELCPNGVEYTDLNEVCKFQNGFAFKSGLFSKTGLPILRIANILDGKLSDDGYICFNPNDYKENLDNYIVRPGNIVVAMSGATTGKIGYNYSNNEYYLNQRVGMFLPDECRLNNRFLYHWLLSQSSNILAISSGTGAQPNLSSVKMMKFKIPVPPLEVQREIVRILDSFTSLTAELTAELTARKQQYQYYLNCFFETQTDNLVPLESIGTLTRGKRFVHADATDTGVPCIHYGELYTYYGVHASAVKSHIREDLRPKMRYAHKGDVIIVGAGENNIDIGVGVAWEGNEDVAVHDACYTLKHSQNSKYISYYLRSDMYHSQIKKYVSEGKICSISAAGLGKAMIPIPSLSEQQRIVSILERFDVLCNDITTGLPAEIEARQKQYEYYRDKLLSFE